MKAVCCVALLGLTLGAFPLCLAQTATPVAPSRSTPKRSQGFLDYALGKINPDNKDYGRSVVGARTGLVSDTIQNLYFWSNVVSLTLFVVTAAALILILQTQDKREIIAANLIAQLWNGRVIDRREIIRRTALYNTLVETTNAGLNQKASSEKDGPHSLGSEDSSTNQLEKKARGKFGVAVSKTPSSRTDQGETGSLPSSEFEQKAKLLEGQNQALRNSERNLRTRLNQVSQDLEQERRRNQTLKGA